MARGRRLSGKRSKKMFAKGASYTHKKNLRTSVPRGGYRM